MFRHPKWRLASARAKQTAILRSTAVSRRWPNCRRSGKKFGSTIVRKLDDPRDFERRQGKGEPESQNCKGNHGDSRRHQPESTTFLGVRALLLTFSETRR